jgi:hypothetical protein
MTDLIFSEVDMPDAVPPSEDVEYPCVVCGRESGPYGGKGPKPKRCIDHKRTAGQGTRRASGSLVEKAADKLVYLNSLLALGAMAFGYIKTAATFAAGEDVFRESVMEALSTDDKLCRTIVRAGQASGMVGLVIAYGTLGAMVVPTMVMEWREKHPPDVIEGEVVG